MNVVPNSIAVGARVRSVRTGQVGHVVGVGSFSHEVLFYGAPLPVQVDPAELEVVVSGESDWLKPAELLALLTAYKINTGLSDVLYGYLASRTTFREYQFLPALRFLEGSSRRLLIADEVGLGKTIEAGLILLELIARGHADRVLIVVPPHLRAKWRNELQRRFDIETVIWEGRDIDDELDRVRRFPTAIRDEQVVIVSQHAMSMATSLDREESDDRPSRTELMAEFGITWDVVIIDEAHHGRNAGTRRHRAFADLSRITDALVFLTATPLNLGNQDLFNLLNILRPDRLIDFDVFAQQIEPAKYVTEAIGALRTRDPGQVRAAIEKIGATDVGRKLSQTTEYTSALAILESDSGLDSARSVSQVERYVKNLHPLAGVFTRTRKRDLPQPFAQRVAKQLQVTWTDEEWEFYNALRHYVVTQRMTSPFALVMPSRQSASCIPAMVERLRENDWITDPSEWQSDADESEEALELSLLPPNTPNRPRPSASTRLQAAAEAVEGFDSKYEVFSRAVRDLLTGEVNQILLFSFFRKTLEYLKRRLTAEGFRVRLMNGDVPMDRRADLIDQFRRGDFDILLSSEVGSEGLDFEFVGCLFNYDLPWNPMVVEQRIGRLDRFGQIYEKILIFNLQIPGTIETDIIDRLYDRIGVFRESIGDLGEIIGEFVESQLIKRLGTLTLSESEKEALAREVEVAVEKQRLVAEELELHKDVLAASADLLEEQFSAIRRTGRYVDPEEIRRLVQSAITTWYDDATWQADGSVHEVTLPMDALTYGPLAPALRSKELMGLGNKINFGSTLRLTFDYETASKDVGVTFLTARHPLVKAIASLVSDNGPAQPFVGGLEIPTGVTQEGSYECWIFEAHVQSLNERIELVPVAFSEAGSRAFELEEVLLGELARNVPAGSAARDLGLAPLVEEAANQIRRQMIEQEEVRFELDQAQRREVITASHQAKIASLEQVVFETRGTRVEQANKARLSAVQQRLVSQLSQLYEAKSPTVHLRHLATLQVHVRSEAAKGSDEFSVPRIELRDRPELSRIAPPKPAPPKGRRRKASVEEFVCQRCGMTKRGVLKAASEFDVCVDCI